MKKLLIVALVVAVAVMFSIPEFLLADTIPSTIDKSDYAIRKSVSFDGDTIVPGDTINYTISIQNKKPSQYIRNVRVEDSMLWEDVQTDTGFKDNLNRPIIPGNTTAVFTGSYVAALKNNIFDFSKNSANS